MVHRFMPILLSQHAPVSHINSYVPTAQLVKHPTKHMSEVMVAY